jgi:hypothetical protein
MAKTQNQKPATSVAKPKAVPNAVPFAQALQALAPNVLGFTNKAQSAIGSNAISTRAGVTHPAIAHNGVNVYVTPRKVWVSLPISLHHTANPMCFLVPGKSIGTGAYISTPCATQGSYLIVQFSSGIDPAKFAAILKPLMAAKGWLKPPATAS